MSANVSRQRQRQVIRQRRVEWLTQFLEEGWRIHGDPPQIVAINTVLGHFQRGQELLLRCSRDDCRRRCEVNLREAIRAGLGGEPLRVLIELSRCQHWLGCSLKEEMAIFPGGVPIIHYLNDDNEMVAIICTGCRKQWLLTAADTIRKLRHEGTGNGNVGILSLAKILRGRCSQCGKAQFETTTIKLKPALGAG